MPIDAEFARKQLISNFPYFFCMLYNPNYVQHYKSLLAFAWQRSMTTFPLTDVHLTYLPYFLRCGRRGQRLITSKGAKRKILDNTTVIQKYVLTNGYRTEWRDHLIWYMYIKFVHKSLSFRKHFVTVLTEDMQSTKFCHEVFVMPKHLIYQNHPHTCLHSVRSLNFTNIVELLWYGNF